MGQYVCPPCSGAARVVQDLPEHSSLGVECEGECNSRFEITRQLERRLAEEPAVKAINLEPVGRGFESLRAHQKNTSASRLCRAGRHRWRHPASRRTSKLIHRLAPLPL